MNDALIFAVSCGYSHSPCRHFPTSLRYKGEPRHISTPGEGTTLSSGKYAKLAMKGKEVYKFATREVPSVLQEALTAADMTVNDIDWLLLHQVCDDE